jgi:hypothetical protein
MADAFNLVFVRIEDGKDPQDVKQKLSAALKTDLDRVQDWIDADGPVTLLKEVDEETAQKVKQVVTRCGGRAIIERVELEESVGGLSLVPKKFRTTEDFVCPACGFHKDVAIGEVVETCDSCGTVIAKWRERQRLEKEKEEIRKRLLREAEGAEMSEEERRRKEEELARLRQLEDEIRRELGLKGPGPLWRFFERHPVTVSLVVCNLVVALSVSATYLYTRYLRAAEQTALEASEPTLEMTQMAPVMASAVQVQQTGNQQLMAEMANVSGVLNGAQPQDTQAIQDAATTMMKGAGSNRFMDLVNSQLGQGPSAAGTPAGKATPRDTMGAVTGLAGVPAFAPGELPAAASPAAGSELVLEVFAKPDQVMATDVNPQAPPRNAIEQLDGSAVIDLVKSLAGDHEWGHFLLGQASALVRAGKFDEADAVTALIADGAARAMALAELQVALGLASRPLDAKLIEPRLGAAVASVGDPQARTDLQLRLAAIRAAAGDKAEPAATLNALRQGIDALQDDYERALSLAALGRAQFEAGDRATARSLFAQAVGAAGRVQPKARRLTAFARMAPVYHRVRATTLASQMLAEVAQLAASELDESESARVFAELAVAHALTGDLAGARLALANTGSLQAQLQVATRQAEAMIASGQHFEAMEVIARITDATLANRLLLRAAAEQAVAGAVEPARRLLDDVAVRLRLVGDPYERAVMQAKLGRLYARHGEATLASEQFGSALAFAGDGPKADVTRVTIAMEQAQALRLEDSLQSLAGLQNPAFGEPVETAVHAIRDVSRHFPPAAGSTAPAVPAAPG